MFGCAIWLNRFRLTAQLSPKVLSNQPKCISLIVECTEFNFKIQEELYLGSFATWAQEILLNEDICLNNLRTHKNDFVLESCSNCRTSGRYF